MASAPSIGRADLNDLLFRAAGGALLGVDQDLMILSANESSCQLFRCRDDEIIDTPLSRWLPGLLDRKKHRYGQPDTTRLLREASSMGTQLEARRLDETFKAEIKATLATSEPKPIWVVTVQDMTFHNESHALLVHAHRELEEFNRLAVGRELRMIELKEEVNRLLAQLGYEARYDIVG